MYQQPDWVKAISLIDQGKVDLAPLVTDRFAFADYQKAYEYIDANRGHTTVGECPQCCVRPVLCGELSS